MIKQILANIVMLLFLSIVEAKLDISQQKFSNPNSVKQKLPKDLDPADDSTITSITNKPSQANEAPSQNFDNYQGPMYQETKFIDVGSNDELVGISDIKKMPAKFIGPRRKPQRIKKFQGIGPTGIEEHEKPSCDDFSKTARFNPYTVINEKWFNFYRWAIDNNPLVVEFIIPTSWEIVIMREFLDKQVESGEPIDWDARMVIMNDIIYNISALLVERNDHGVFWLYAIRPNHKGSVVAEDVRFKQTADNRFIAFVLCADDRAFIFSREREVPLKDDIPEAVAAIGWRGRDGRSYLYQGSQWAPVPDFDEEEYWRPTQYQKVEPLPPPPEIYDPEKDDVKIFGKKF